MGLHTVWCETPRNETPVQAEVVREEFRSPDQVTIRRDQQSGCLAKSAAEISSPHYPVSAQTRTPKRKTRSCHVPTAPQKPTKRTRVHTHPWKPAITESCPNCQVTNICCKFGLLFMRCRTRLRPTASLSAIWGYCLQLRTSAR